NDAPRLYDLSLAPEARSARQPLLPQADARAAREHGRSPPSRPGPDLLRGLRLPVPLPEPVQGQRRLPRHAVLIDLPHSPARYLRGGRLRLPPRAGAPPGQRRPARMGGWPLLAVGPAGGDLPVLRLGRDPHRAARALLLGGARLGNP